MFLYSCGLETLMHLSSVLQCHTAFGSMAAGETKLFVDERISTVVLDEELRLLKVGESFEGEVGGTSVIDRIFKDVRVSGNGRKLTCRYHSRRPPGMWMIDDKGLSELEWPCQ